MAAQFTSDDYLAALKALRPRGLVWPDEAEATQVAALAGLAPSYGRSDEAAMDLLVDAFPPTSVDLLPEWEESLGLPDPCAGPSPTVPQRQAQVLARLVGGGGQSAARFIAFAAHLGFTIGITTYSPFRVGRNSVGDPLAGPAWSYAWGVTILANTSGLDASVLLCELRAIKPAQTTLFLLS